MWIKEIIEKEYWNLNEKEKIEKFKEKLKEFWYKIERNSDITAEMQDNYKFLVLNLK